ncbi:endonuclease domain-containing 1 protein-like [Astyanax mexicanus]|uniref:Endonuclease domain-containing 1 protein-like n=1 Tax=Astyanax mexicanus TaxID=7994 RepID=A0A8T2KW30_ASTMX|nr:endonuclease domain-containing 1 protein-like [Astyanax mexicanus]KAG9259401.1 endonuclease domain-containing 1 protein-like [Astyanax mexicanus]KAG9262085.1 endonuclease domain-containing 1 protein-like [Astyanax mexicanus]
MKLLTLLLLLGVVSLAMSKVVKSFTECIEFFMVNPEDQNKVITSVLEGERYRQICQVWNGKQSFATLYDTYHRIPVYSAYVFNQKNRGFGDGFVWKIEPQLDDLPGDEMRASEGEILKNQAEDPDYNIEHEGCRYTRGHVFPRGHAVDKDHTDSTYTLTNAAPQLMENNNNWATQVENVMRRQIKAGCVNEEAYIVAGVIPGETWLPIKRGSEDIEHGVNVPKFFWSAYYCKNKKNIVKCKAFLSEQKPCKSTEKNKLQPREMGIDELNKILSDYYEQDVIIFPGK